ncbi:MAG: M3 family metallopeptidase [Gammaproteobacteria bacterium]
MTDENPLLIRAGLPAFDRIEPGHVAPAIDALLARCRAIVAAVERAEEVSWQALMVPLEEIDLLFEYGWAPIGHLLGVANSDALRTAHDAVLPAVVQFGLEFRQSEILYRKLRQLKDSPAWGTFENAQRRIVERTLQVAELSGITLQGAARTRFNEIETTLSQLATRFSNQLLDATKAWWLDLDDPAAVAGLPDTLRRMTATAWSHAEEHRNRPPASPETGPWRITLDAPCFGPFMEHCRDRSLRERVYRAFIARAASAPHDNTPLVTGILQLRREKARLLGYRSYAEVSLAQKMAGTVDAVDAMHARLLAAALPAAERELAELTRFARARGHTGDLAHWDVAFWAERMREEKYAFTDEELRPYFSLDRVLDGLFELCQRLFGIRVRAAHDHAPRWHPDVRFYEIDDECGRHVASFYLDPYSRPQNKRGGAWMNDCIQRTVTADGVRLPVAHLVCNGTPPTGDVPSLMTFREVETLFHEFGHGLQHMLTTVGFRDAAGIAGVEWDAVELPSQFMENWCLHRPTLMGMALHYQSGTPLPDALFEKLRAAKTYRAASAMLRQLQFGMTDMALHHDYDPAGAESPFDVERRIAARTSLLPPLPENRFLCSFSHIFAGGYSAGYYSYKWAEVLSADAFSAFEDANLDDAAAVAATGHRFRDTVLAQGGSRHPLEVFREFRGRDPDPAALLRHHGLLAA